MLLDTFPDTPRYLYKTEISYQHCWRCPVSLRTNKQLTKTVL